MILVFDIETIPDIAAGKKLYNFEGLSDEEVVQALFALRRQKVGHDFLPHYLQKIVAISCVLASEETVKVWSIGNEDSKEQEIIHRFFLGLKKHVPTLVSWNGSGFDLPVLHYRALLQGIEAAQYWEYGEKQSEFRWNNYLNRFHYRHLDLMDVLSAYQSKAYAPLDDIAVLLGFPGKMGMSGQHVWKNYLAGQIQDIRNYCETDVLNTYCIYLRFELMRGHLTQATYSNRLQILKNHLSQSEKAHLIEFCSSMENA